MIRLLISLIFLINTAFGASYIDVKNLIQEKSLTSVDEVLNALPTHYFKNYVLIHNSGSLQESSPLKPRAIVFSDHADFMMSFNSDENHKGRNKLEFIEFDDDSKQFEFFEISFEKQGVHFSDKNPKKCLFCHGQDPRPNWAPYNRWDTAFGTEHLGSIETIKKDAKRISSFIHSLEDKSRYSKLAGISLLNSGKAVRSNIELNRMLNRQNDQRLLRKLKSYPFYEVYKYTILASLICGPDYSSLSFSDFFPSKEMYKKHWRKFQPNRIKYRQNTYNGKVRSNQQTIEENFLSIMHYFGISTNDWDMLFKEEVLVFGRFNDNNSGLDQRLAPRLILSDMDLIDHKSLILSGENFDPFSPHGTALDPNIMRRSKQCQELKSKSKFSLSQNTALIASVKEEQSNQDFLSIKKERIEIAMGQAPASFRKCLECHMPPRASAPSFPFYEKGLMMESLIKKSRFNKDKTLFEEIQDRLSTDDPHKVMPPKPLSLSDNERSEIIDYLKNLLNK